MINESFTNHRLFNNTPVRHAKILKALNSCALLRHSPFDLNGKYPSLEVMGDMIRVHTGLITHAYVMNEQVSVKPNSPLDADDIDLMLHEVSYGRPAIAPVTRTEATKLFNEMWTKFEKKGYRKPYDTQWANGTGYFNVTKLPEDRSYDSFSFVDDKSRKGLVLWDCLSGSRFVVFERYSDNGLIAYNHTFGCQEGVSGAGAIHATPYIIGRMMDINRYASLND